MTQQEILTFQKLIEDDLGIALDYLKEKDEVKAQALEWLIKNNIVPRHQKHYHFYFDKRPKNNLLKKFFIPYEGFGQLSAPTLGEVYYKALMAWDLKQYLLKMQ